MAGEMKTLGLGFTWEQLSAGQKFRTLNRTITEADLMMFIGVTGMVEVIFTDQTFGAGRGAIQGRFVPAALTYSLIEGLLCQSMIQGTGLAMLELNKKVLKPVRVGDTIHAEVEVTSVRPTSKGNRGIVASRVDIKNQDGEVVISYDATRCWPARRRNTGEAMEKYQDILFDVRDGVAKITINRPEKYNAFTAETCEELIDAFRRAGSDRSVAVIVLGGAGDKAFCTGADQSAHEGAYEGRGTIGLPIDELQSLIRDVPKPVIARVQGFAIGGGNVLATLCDLTIASEKRCSARSGRKSARSIRASARRICRGWSARSGRGRFGISAAATRRSRPTRWAWSTRWCRRTSSTPRSTSGAPRSGRRARPRIAIAKRSFNADSENLRAIGALGFEALALFYGTEESKEGGGRSARSGRHEVTGTRRFRAPVPDQRCTLRRATARVGTGAQYRSSGASV